jgi:hypothetical protein
LTGFEGAQTASLSINHHLADYQPIFAAWLSSLGFVGFGGHASLSFIFNMPVDNFTVKPCRIDAPPAPSLLRV